MLKIEIDAIDEAFLKQLCEEGYSESSTLDFKRQLPSKLEQDKIEIAKDVCAMANADGGYIIYGIDEVDGQATQIIPISESRDPAHRRIIQILDSGIEPRVPGVRIRTIDVTGGYVMAVCVESSYDGPHCVRNNSNRRFVMRNGTTTTEMTFDQIRVGFTRSEILTQHARQFSRERYGKIGSFDSPIKMQTGAYMVLHFMPLVALAGRARIDIHSLYKGGYEQFRLPRDANLTRKINFDGLAIYDGVAESYGYKFIYRRGLIEAVSLAGQVRQISPSRSSGVAILFSKEITQNLRAQVEQFINVAGILEMPGAAVLHCALLNARGYHLQLGNDTNIHNLSEPSGRSEYVLDPVWIESVEQANVDRIVAAILNTLWQGFGRTNCPHYDEAGNYLL
ncbi:hypothetical protein GTP44_11815 [Duganella sp. FT50W]|uniref:Schlafen AlbA-2 domain-containing protein n=1 Tax=Duganella lactea TaxID=2692173 RepID=A0A6L8MHU1_9BURK|nr:ATP-binding protein [Duganella lactea]MYM82640.1 hypothetical protein [Duganella lactea]